jgi:putative oxidoreductase
MTMQNKILWVLQWLFGVYFVAVGIMHLVLPEGLPEPLSWMYDLDDTQHMLSGVAEILGGLGLILPSLTRIAPWLTPLAAIGLMIVMIAAILFHVGRDEIANVGINVFNLLVLGYIAWGRSRLVPIVAR